MFPHTIEFAETHRLATQVEERLSLDLEMPSDVPARWSANRQLPSSNLRFAGDSAGMHRIAVLWLAKIAICLQIKQIRVRLPMHIFV